MREIRSGMLGTWSTAAAARRLGAASRAVIRSRSVVPRVGVTGCGRDCCVRDLQNESHVRVKVAQGAQTTRSDTKNMIPNIVQRQRLVRVSTTSSGGGVSPNESSAQWTVARGHSLHRVMPPLAVEGWQKSRSKSRTPSKRRRSSWRNLPPLRWAMILRSLEKSQMSSRRKL